MWVRLIQPLAALATIGLLAGCTDLFYEHRLIPPQGGGGQPCLDRCTRMKDECEGRQRVREQGCAERAAAAKSVYEHCLGAKSGPCIAPEACLELDLTICERQYQECFTACGGRVEQQIRPLPWRDAPPTPPASTTGSPPA